MRKIYYLLLCMVAALTSCNSEMKQVKEFAIDFADKVSKNQVDSVRALYPDAAICDSFALTYIVDSIQVMETETPGIFKVIICNTDFVVKKTEDGTMTVTESHGLIAFPNSKLGLARKTGLWKKGITDVDLTKRMKDDEFFKYLLSNFTKSLKDALKIVETKTYGDQYYGGEWVSCDGITFTVKNNSSHIIAADVYSIVYKEGYWGSWPAGATTTVIPGVEVPANGTVEIKSPKGIGPTMESETSQNIRINDMTLDNLCTMGEFKGNEYEEFLKNKKIE